jgi:iron-sulfur cluster repair protein YtfE (RIC family)
MIQTAHKTIGEIAAGNPASVKVFQKYDIDFRCGGKRPLDEVCAEKGIMERVVKNHGVRHGDSLFPLQQSFLALKDELEVHLRKEEMVLFPHILQTEEARRTNTPGPCSCFGSMTCRRSKPTCTCTSTRRTTSCTRGPGCYSRAGPPSSFGSPSSLVG